MKHAATLTSVLRRKKFVFSWETSNKLKDWKQLQAMFVSSACVRVCGWAFTYWNPLTSILTAYQGQGQVTNWDKDDKCCKLLPLTPLQHEQREKLARAEKAKSDKWAARMVIQRVSIHFNCFYLAISVTVVQCCPLSQCSPQTELVH